MKKKLPIAIRGILSTAFLLLGAALLNTTPVQSAFPNAPTAGTLEVVNDLVNNNNGPLLITDFEFSINNGVDWIPFEGDGQNDLPLDNGVYTVIGRPVAGYATTYTNCTAIEILDNTIRCTITNDDISPELTIIKVVDNNNGGTLNPGDFSINITGTNVSQTPILGAADPGTTITLDAGAYEVAETPVTGYEPSYSTDCSGTIAVGETRTCTITNQDFARLTVIKDPTNNNGGTALPDDFQLTVGGSPVLSGVPGEYQIDTSLAINETQLVGYTFVSITDDGSGKCPAVLGGTVTLALGDDITCTIVNDDVPAINPVPDSGLVTDENGTTDEFTVVLTTIPTNTVSIAVSSSLPTEATASPAVLNFTVDNWDTPQPVTVTGVNDMVADGDISYNIILNPAGSAAVEYAGLPAVLVSGTNFDNDTAGYIITPTDNYLTTEGGVAQKVTIALRSRPTAIVTLSLSNSDSTEGSLSTTSIIIEPSPWPQPAKEFTVTGVDDILVDGNVPYSITISASSTDTNYSGPVAVLPFINHDAPTIEWYLPVGNEEFYYVTTPTCILLEVRSVGNEPISKVRFYRWVPSVNDWVTIGEDLTEPYQESLCPDELEFGWNEIRAFAFGPVPTEPGEIQTFSPHPYIFINKEYGDFRMNIPLIRR